MRPFPPALERDDQRVSEARFRFGYALRSATVATLLMAVGFFLGGASILGIFELMLGVGFLLMRRWGLASRRPERLRKATQITLAGAYLAILLTAWLTGGSDSFALWFLAMLPLLGALLAKRRTVLLWTGISGLTAVLLWAGQPSIPAAPWESFSPLPKLFTLLTLIYLSAAFGQALRRSNALHIKALDKRLATEHQARLQADEAWQAEATARHTIETAHRTMVNFLATLSHELRTPLNAVIGINNLLLDMNIGDQERELVKLAHQSGETLLEQVNDFLDFSKIEAGQLTLEPLVFDPHSVIKGTVALLREQAQRKGLRLDCDVSAPHGVRGDPARLRQILMNLLSNAVKFTPQGWVALRTQALAESPQVWLRFEVEDTGIGIDEMAQARLFQPFVQADASTTRRFGGTGLGLAICKELTRLMGGRIGVQSEIGKGSLFWVELPFEAVPPEAWPKESPEVENLQDVRPLAKHCRVLLVEDHPVNQITAREMLKRLGCQVDVVGNGEEAVQSFEQLPYDLIFMDCNMPVMDGFEASRLIRLTERPDHHVPIVAMTAAALAEDRNRCMMAGMDDYLAKPVRLSDLQSMLSRWLPSDLRT